jgi:FAD/FMN-containing dehydrogenase
MPGSNVGPGVMLDLTRAFRSAPVVDPVRRSVRIGAAHTWRTLTAAAAAHRLRLPPDPSSGAFCTVGGMVATNAAGPRSLKFGAMRDWVTGIDFITADGERGRAAAPVEAERSATTAAERRALALAGSVPAAALVRRPARKNSSGYDLAALARHDVVRLLVGSEGTLALVDTVELRLAPVPASAATMLVTLGDLRHVERAVLALAEHDPAAVELLDRTFLDFVRAAAQGDVPAGTEAVVLAEFEGEDDAAAKRAAAAARALAPVATGIATATDPATVARLWAIRHRASPALAALPDTQRSLQVVEDGCVPRDRLAEYIEGLRRLAAEHQFGVVIFGHAGDGHVHANVLADVTAPDLAARLGSLLGAASALQIALGGTLAGEHGDGRLRAPYLADLFGVEYVEWCRRLKAAFDPHGILNPGVKLGAPDAPKAPPPDWLKVGAAAPALPASVAAEFRRMEREGDWRGGLED